MPHPYDRPMPDQTEHPAAHQPDIEALRRRLAARPPAGLPPQPLSGDVSAAVLVPLVPGPGGWYLVFIRRTDTSSHHRGEIAFPGGRVEAGETTLQGALREAQEELGIPPDAVDVLGSLEVVQTRVSRFAVTPWVGVLRLDAAGSLVAAASEVAAVLEIPLAALSRPQARREQRYVRGRVLTLSPAFDADGVTIWGATARIVADLLEAIR